MALISPLVFAVLFPLAAVFAPPFVSETFIFVLYALGIPERYGPGVTQAIFSGTILVLGTFCLAWRIRLENRLHRSPEDRTSE